ncbi:hypothetical protein GCM10016455_15520 [Aliiroseovarius zhejiangensis]|uniref:SRPBCC family protein n=1 Tax=Aliiroseovarius zhejiangensis TaxID=1632025 RepID=A0ABQ3J1N0_9RHOB|nr:hypothetical protein [Aliiroseovarius zhejiangensis]GHE96074.1 hypothetical protein GCM10016455_15520 [Aliiroseovarius zhejiangensis]
MMTYKTLTAGLLAASMLTAPAFADDMTMVKEVDVDVELEDLANANAAAHWTMIEDDLENAIVERLVGRTDDEGVRISIDIDEIELANTLQNAAGVADSSLSGRVKILSPNDNSKFETYDLSVAFDQAILFLPEGFDVTALTTDSKEYYDGMIAAFADHVVKRLDG